MRPGTAADHADLLTATADLCQRTATRIFETLHQHAPANSPLWEATPRLVLDACADIADLMLWPLLREDNARLVLAQSIAMGAVAVGARAVGRSWP
jgi:hypothetical protein